MALFTVLRTGDVMLYVSHRVGPTLVTMILGSLTTNKPREEIH